MRKINSMRKLSLGLSSMLHGMTEDDSFAKKAYRAAQVREMWAAVVDDIFLDHTNSIYILNENGIKTLIVYVDESIFAAELNARRELIKLKLLQQFGEDVDEFKILISRGSYKKNYPFKNEKISPSFKNKKPLPLSEEEKKKIEDIVSVVENESLKQNLKKAMTADWQIKKAENPVEKDRIDED